MNGKRILYEKRCVIIIRRFIRLTTFIVIGNEFIEKDKMFLLSRIHSATIHNDFDDALILWDGKGHRICDVKMSLDELITLMQSPIEIEI